MTRYEVLQLIKECMPSPDRIYDTPEEVVIDIWNNIKYEEEKILINGD